MSNTNNQKSISPNVKKASANKPIMINVQKNGFLSKLNQLLSTPNTTQLKETAGLEKGAKISQKSKESTLLSKDKSKKESKMDEKAKKENAEKEDNLSSFSNETSGQLMMNSKDTDANQSSPSKRKNEMSNEYATTTCTKSPKKLDDNRRSLEVNEKINQTKDLQLDQYFKDGKNQIGFLHPKKEDVMINGKNFQERYLTTKIFMDTENREYHIQGIPHIHFQYKEISDGSDTISDPKGVSKNENLLTDFVLFSQTKMIEFSPKYSTNQSVLVEPALFEFDNVSFHNNSNNVESHTGPLSTNNFSQTDILSLHAPTIYSNSSIEDFVQIDCLGATYDNSFAGEYIIGDVPNLEFDKYEFHDALLKKKFVPVTRYKDFFDHLTCDETNCIEIAFVSEKTTQCCFYGYNPFLDNETTIKMNNLLHSDDIYLQIMNFIQSTQLYFFITPHSNSNFASFFADQDSNHSVEKIKPKQPTKDQLLTKPYLVQNRGVSGILCEDNKFYSLTFSDNNEISLCPVYIYVRGKLIYNHPNYS